MIHISVDLSVILTIQSQLTSCRRGVSWHGGSPTPFGGLEAAAGCEDARSVRGHHWGESFVIEGYWGRERESEGEWGRVRESEGECDISSWEEYREWDHNIVRAFRLGDSTATSPARSIDLQRYVKLFSSFFLLVMLVLFLYFFCIFPVFFKFFFFSISVF